MSLRSIRRVVARLVSRDTLRQVRDVLLGSPSVISLWWRNRSSREPVTGNADVVVTMSTHGRRFRTAFFALEAIGRGVVRPRRLILWVDDVRLLERIPPSLLRMRERGLELRGGDPRYRPHNKYVPHVLSGRDADLPFVIVDDDALYARHVLAELLETAASNPGAIVANRAHRIELDGGRILPYAQWSDARPGPPTLRAMPTGRSGVLYPPVMSRALRDAGERFLECAPRADDIWLHAVAVRTRTPVVLTPRAPRNFGLAPVRDPGGLSIKNIVGGGNDAQIKATYGADDIAAIAASSD